MTIDNLPAGGMLWLTAMQQTSTVLNVTFSGSEAATTIYIGSYNNSNQYGIRRLLTLASGGSRTFVTDAVAQNKASRAFVFR